MTGVAPVPAASGPVSEATAAEAARSAERFAAALTAATAAPASTPPAVRRFVTLGEMATGIPTPAGASALFGARIPGFAGAAGGGTSGSAVIEAASKYLGVPYRWGGTDPATGLDCSGFVQRVYADLGVSLPRVSVDQSRAGTAVPSLDQAQPGDLVFWRGSPNHIGIYAGDGQMIVAPRSGDVVKFQKITRTPHEIRRVL